MTFLIDGYNLMHAVGLASRGMPAGGLHRARGRFLDWLADSVRGRADELSVVFDSRSTVLAETAQDHRGVRVQFSQGRTADEWIEERVRSHPRPSELGVVSNDGQVREAARLRGCAVLACEEFVDRLLEEPSKRRSVAPEPPEKLEPEATSAEMAEWLDAFSTPKPRRRRS